VLQNDVAAEFDLSEHLVRSLQRDLTPITDEGLIYYWTLLAFDQSVGELIIASINSDGHKLYTSI